MIATWNPNGLSDLNKFSRVIRRAKSEGIDALLIQEHNLRSSKQLAAAAFRARVAGFSLHIARRSLDSSRGGTAVLVREDSDIRVVGRACTALDGAYCAVPVSIGGHNTRLISPVYGCNV